MIDAFMQNILKSSLYEKVEITASGTWTVPTAVNEIVVAVVGSGAGGVSVVSGEGGGGGEIFVAFDYIVTPGDSIPVTVGAGGTAGNNGNYSRFGTLYANGGATLSPSDGGQGYNRTAGGGSTGDSGILSSGENLGCRFISISGGGGTGGGSGSVGGDTAFALGGAVGGGASGGGASWGAGGAGSAGTGSAGTNGGGGGAGSTGGAGGDGIIIVFYRKLKNR
jgi:hypothetical protein